jgi:hypothetical protein
MAIPMAFRPQLAHCILYVIQRYATQMTSIYHIALSQCEFGN